MGKKQNIEFNIKLYDILDNKIYYLKKYIEEINKEFELIKRTTIIPELLYNELERATACINCYERCKERIEKEYK